MGAICAPKPLILWALRPIVRVFGGVIRYLTVLRPLYSRPHLPWGVRRFVVFPWADEIGRLVSVGGIISPEGGGCGCTISTRPITSACDRSPDPLQYLGPSPRPVARSLGPATRSICRLERSTSGGECSEPLCAPLSAHKRPQISRHTRTDQLPLSCGLSDALRIKKSPTDWQGF